MWVKNVGEVFVCALHEQKEVDYECKSEVTIGRTIKSLVLC